VNLDNLVNAIIGGGLGILASIPLSYLIIHLFSDEKADSQEGTKESKEIIKPETYRRAKEVADEILNKLGTGKNYS